MDAGWGDTSDFSLTERDSEVLHVIGEEGLRNFTFDGLKRRLGLHSETLSRILLRLEEEGIVEKGIGGYAVTSKARKLLLMHPMSVSEHKMPLLQTLLSPNISTRQIVSELRGKWFGMLRWLGYSENEDGLTLTWITEDGGTQVDVVFSGNSLSIEAKLLHEKDTNNALRASYQLIGYISRLYSRKSRLKHVAY